MSYPWTAYKTWITGEILTAADLNNTVTRSIDNSIPTSIDDYSGSTATMRSTADPYPAAAESLASTLAGELERLRYVHYKALQAILGTSAVTQWYMYPGATYLDIFKITTTGIALTPSSNQLVLGTGRTVTITAPTPAASSRTWTVPDISADATFAALEGSQTFSGAKTFSGGLVISSGINVTAAPTNAYDTTNILYLNAASPSTKARVLRFSGAVATDQMVYCPANSDDLRFATTSGSTITDMLTLAATAATFAAAVSVNITNTKLKIGSNQVYPVLQVAQVSTVTKTTTVSTSFADTTLTTSITPKFAGSKIKITATGVMRQGNGASGFATLSRNGTNLMDATNGGVYLASNQVSPITLIWYDAPATTSATTYTLQIRTGNGTIQSFFPDDAATGTAPTAVMILEEIAQ